MDQGQSYGGLERRRHPRAATHIPLKVSREDGEIVTETVNLSRSGAYCRVDKRIELMTKLKIQILLPLRKGEKGPTRTIHCQGVVVRVEPSTTEQGCYHIAVFFNEIAKRDAEAISDYVNSCLEEESSEA